MGTAAKITAQLKEIEYTPRLANALEVFSVDDLRKGELATKASFIVQCGGEEYAVSQWVSPKRTRTYPFARVYDTLGRKNRVTLIPFCKDEGADGDRDFLQWDTVSLMSLLNVHVIVCYYARAEKNERPAQQHRDKITAQVLDYDYVCKKLGELQNYHSSALHWNLKQMEGISDVATRTLTAYREIKRQTGVRLHGEKGLQKRIEIAEQEAARFREMSRKLAQEAQVRETMTEQPKEKTVGRKAVVTLENLLGGVYYWTADECFVLDGRVVLVEKKHSKTKLLPSAYDLKDAFIKSALFCNIDSLQYDGEMMPCYWVVGLTSGSLRGCLHSGMAEGEVNQFFSDNGVGEEAREFVLSAIAEAKGNGFGLFLMNEGEVGVRQEEVMRVLSS